MRVAGKRLSFHAAERMVEMGLTVDDVADCVERFKNRYEQSKYGPGRVMYQNDLIGVATAERAGEEHVIVSILWNRKEQWDR